MTRLARGRFVRIDVTMIKKTTTAALHLHTESWLSRSHLIFCTTSIALLYMQSYTHIRAALISRFVWSLRLAGRGRAVTAGLGGTLVLVLSTLYCIYNHIRSSLACSPAHSLSLSLSLCAYSIISIRPTRTTLRRRAAERLWPADLIPRRRKRAPEWRCCNLTPTHSLYNQRRCRASLLIMRVCLPPVKE